MPTLSPNLKGFTEGMDEFIEECEDELVYVKQELTNTVFRNLVENSPYPANMKSAWSYGSYVLSHRIGIGKSSNRPPTDVSPIGWNYEYGMPEGPPMLNGEVFKDGSIAHITALDEINKAKLKIVPYGNIVIDNHIPWVYSVELGWTSRNFTGIGRNKVGGYHTYGLSYAFVETNLQQFVDIWSKKFEAKHKGKHN
jgi:hypothetical protein